MSFIFHHRILVYIWARSAILVAGEGREGMFLFLLFLHFHFCFVLGFNDTSTLVSHFVSSPREREKRDRRDSRGDNREGQGRKRNKNESEETEETETSPSSLTSYKDSRPCRTVSQYQLAAPVM